MLLGIATGLLTPTSWMTPLRLVGNGFRRLFQMPVLPFLSLSLMAGIGRLELNQAGRLLSRAAFVLLLLWLIALLSVLLLPLGFPNWQEATFFRPSLLQAPKPLDLLQLFIPVNPFEAYAQTQIPAVVLFSLAIGLALIVIPNRQPLIQVMDRFNDALLRLSAFIAEFTPIGVFAILATTTAGIDASDVPRLVVYVGLLGGTALILTFVVLPLFVQGVTPIGAIKLVKRFRTPLVIAFATANLLVVLPLLVERSKELLLEARSKQLQLPDESRDTKELLLQELALPVEVLMPLAMVFPDMGRLLSLAFVPFAGWLSNTPLPLQDIPGFLVTGLASAFLEGVLAMTFLLDRLGMPSDLVQLYIALDQLAVARLGTLLACMSVISLVLASTWLSLGWGRWKPATLIPAALSVLFLPLFVVMSRLGFSQLSQPVNTQKQQLLNQQFLLAKGPAKVIQPLQSMDSAGSWTAIQERGSIRYCIKQHDYPMSYRNNSGALVGADVELGLLFAETMGLQAEFIEQTSLGLSGGCDLMLSKVYLDPTQAPNHLLSGSLENYALALLLQNPRFSNLRTWDDLNDGDSLRIGLVENAHCDQPCPEKPFLQQWFKQLLPKAKLVICINGKDLLEKLRSNQVDLAVLPAEKASSWTVLHPELRLSVPQPVQKLPITRQLPLRAETLERTWHNWMRFQRVDGTRQKIFEHWVEGLASANQKS